MCLSGDGNVLHDNDFGLSVDDFSHKDEFKTTVTCPIVRIIFDNKTVCLIARCNEKFWNDPKLGCGGGDFFFSTCFIIPSKISGKCPHATFFFQPHDIFYCLSLYFYPQCITQPSHPFPPLPTIQSNHKYHLKMITNPIPSHHHAISSFYDHTPQRTL